jgi:hypothetical protein
LKEVDMETEKEILIIVREPGPDGDETTGKLISQETLTTSDGLEAVEKMLASLRVKLLRRLTIEEKNFEVSQSMPRTSSRGSAKRGKNRSNGLSALQAVVVLAMKRYGQPLQEYKALYPHIDAGADAGTPEDTTKLRNVIQALKGKGFVVTTASGARELTSKGQSFSM